MLISSRKGPGADVLTTGGELSQENGSGASPTLSHRQEDITTWKMLGRESPFIPRCRHQGAAFLPLFPLWSPPGGEHIQPPTRLTTLGVTLGQHDLLAPRPRHRGALRVQVTPSAAGRGIKGGTE